jgi:type I restriction enzyme, S subunit
MNAERLLAQYEQIADAPGAIGRLRRFILDLAVRGKLVPQDPKDEPASELLKRIVVEKVRLAKVGEIKAEKSLPPVGDGAEFDVPSNWRWTRLGVVTSYIQRGKSPKYATSDGAAVVSQKCVQWAGLDLTVAKQVTKESLAEYEPIRFIRDSDLLWNSTGTGTIGRVIRVVQPPEKLVCDSHVTIVRCLEVDPEYIRSWLRSDRVYGQVEDRAAGSTNQVELTANMAINQVVPLPPLAEQHRIVAKVDELMALCDRLDAARAEREATRDRLAASSLARLNAPDPETFQDDARFVLNALPVLTTRPDQIKQLRQTILTLAVRGKLVPQDPKDEPAAELLKRIEKKRAHLLKSGYPNQDEARTQIKKLAEQSVPEGLETLPNSWAWATLLQCSALVIDCKNKTAPYASSGIRLIRTTNVRDGRMNLNDQKYVDQKTYEIWSARCTPEPGDILITREAPMGEVCPIPPGEQICLGQRMMLARLLPDTIDSNFMIYSLRDPKLMDRVQDKPIGATVQHLRVGGVETLLVPLPPLAEQHRIVAKVDELMALCDQLEASLTDTATTRRRLLDALLAEALKPAEVREVEAVA